MDAKRALLVIAVGAVLGVLLAGGSLVWLGVTWFHEKYGPIPKDMAQRPWTTQTFCDASPLVMDLPWQLKRPASPRQVAPETQRSTTSVATCSHFGNGLQVTAWHLRFRPGASFTAKAAAEQSAANMEGTPGYSAVHASEPRATTIAGLPAADLGSSFDFKGRPYVGRQVILSNRSDYYDVELIAPAADRQAAQATWKRILASIRPR